jgi:hypothetical protein
VQPAISIASPIASRGLLEHLGGQTKHAAIAKQSKEALSALGLEPETP